jgi:hypothetical protein
MIDKNGNFVCPQCGRRTDVLVCENNVTRKEGGDGYRPRFDGCGRCIDVYGVMHRFPVEIVIENS